MGREEWKVGSDRQLVNTCGVKERHSRHANDPTIILIIWATPLLLSAQQPDEAASAAIRALEHEWVDAQSHNNNRALDLILDNAVVYVEYGQLVPKGDYLSRIKNEDPTTDEIVMEPIDIRIFESTAIVTGSYREIQRKNGRRITTRWRFVDT